MCVKSNLLMQADTDTQRCEKSQSADARWPPDLHVGPLALLPFGCLLGIAQPFGGRPFKGVEVSFVAGQLAAVQVQDVGAHHIQEISSV